MPVIERIAPGQWRSAPWGDDQGLSHEIARWDNAGVAPLARVSIAEIARAGAFTSMPGRRRCTVVLADGGGLRLAVDGVEHALGVGAALRYDGGATVTAALAGPARVWNLIAGDDLAWDVTVATAPIAASWPAGAVVLLALEAGQVTIDGVALEVAHEDTLIATSSLPIRLAVAGRAIVAHLAIAPAAPRGVAAVALAPQVVVELDGAAMTTVAGFHAELARGLGLPPWYGANLDALIDCLTCLDEPAAGMSTLHAPLGGTVVLAVARADAMPEALATALADAIAFVNFRRRERGQPAVVTLAAAR
ncbi:MAG: HutD family protein [Kofleriaceae bacterium]|nr:HutD family protein [Kofleriaceae bacterium]MBP9167929.1 HutD family protein [Kofleriaceae bacterium]MBP9856763.1 HutD family protein [Kofleriaceae bacterium]